MPQLSLYIDDVTLKKLKTAAKIEHLSVSKYAVKALHETLEKGWPLNYEDLYGCIDDETFQREPANWTDDVPREQL